MKFNQKIAFQFISVLNFEFLCFIVDNFLSKSLNWRIEMEEIYEISFFKKKFFVKKSKKNLIKIKNFFKYFS